MALDPSSVGFTSAPSHFDYDWRTTALYALGIGATRAELDYLYERRGPRVYPTFAVCPVMPATMECLAKTGGDFDMVVHGGQSVRMHRPIPPSGRLTTTAKLTALYDLKKLGQAIVETRTQLADGEPVFDTVWSILYRSAGGFGGPRPPKNEGVDLPKGRAPDFHVEMPTSPEQALLYRLSGDTNPLHADPEFARSVGFEQGPILHGLCTYGFVARAVVTAACAGDGDRLKRLDGGFRRPVWPGDTIVVDGFRVDGGTIALQVTVKGRPDAVMTQAWAEISADPPSAATSSTP
jgi:acyl dehydratase